MEPGDLVALQGRAQVIATCFRVKHVHPNSVFRFLEAFLANRVIEKVSPVGEKAIYARGFPDTLIQLKKMVEKSDIQSKKKDKELEVESRLKELEKKISALEEKIEKK